MGYLKPDEGGEEQYTEGTEGEAPFAADAFDDQPLPPAGPYPSVVCVEAELTRSKKGNPMIVVTLSSSEPEASGKYWIVNSKGSERFKDGLAVFGITSVQAKDALEGGGKEAVAQLFVGKKVSATAKHDMYQGAKQFKWDAIEAPPEGAGYREFGTDRAA